MATPAARTVPAMHKRNPRSFSYLLSTSLLSLALLSILSAPMNPAAAQADADAAAAVSEAAATASPEPQLGYDGGFFVKSSDNRHELKIQGRVQTRYELASLDQGEAVERDTEGAFSIARARLTLKGHVHTKSLKYKFQTDFGKGSVALKDFYDDYTLPSSSVQLRAGQWKRPFSRQQITSSGSMELVDRAITDKFFAGGRDIGVAIHNGYEKSPRVEWVLGVFNGTGDTSHLGGDVVVDPMTGQGEIVDGRFSNVPDEMRPTLVARVGYNHNGIKGYSEADLEGGPFRLAMGASSIAEMDASNGEASVFRGEFDYAVKLHGLSTTGGIYFATIQNGFGMFDQAMDAVGTHVQLGYVIGEHVQPSIRYARISHDRGPDDFEEVTGALSVFAFSHNFKWQTEGSVMREPQEIGRTTDYRVRTQLQLAF